MDVAAKAVLGAQRLRHPHQVPHGVVLVARDAGRQEQSLDAVAPVEIERELDDLRDREPRALDIARAAAHAIGAVVAAEVGEQDLQQRDAAPVRRIGVADAGAGGRADPAVAGGAPGAAGRCAGGVVFGRVREDFELLQQGLGHSPSLLFTFCSFCGQAHSGLVIPALSTVSSAGEAAFSPAALCARWQVL